MYSSGDSRADCFFFSFSKEKKKQAEDAKRKGVYIFFLFFRYLFSWEGGGEIYFFPLSMKKILSFKRFLRINQKGEQTYPGVESRKKKMEEKEEGGVMMMMMNYTLFLAIEVANLGVLLCARKEGERWKKKKKKKKNFLA